MKKTRIVIPREHGGWAMVSVPYIIGMAAAKPVLLHLPLFLAWLCLYMASYPFLQSLKKTSQRKTWISWGIVYALIAVVFLIPVLVFKPSMLWFAPVLLILIMVNVWHVLKKAERALLNDICAILLFCTGGAAAYMLGAVVSIRCLPPSLCIISYISRAPCSLSNRYSVSGKTGAGRYTQEYIMPSCWFCRSSSGIRGCICHSYFRSLRRYCIPEKQ